MPVPTHASFARAFFRFFFQLEKMGRNLIQIRQRFHPLQAKELVVAMTALFFHMVLQLWLYHTGRYGKGQTRCRRASSGVGLCERLCMVPGVFDVCHGILLRSGMVQSLTSCGESRG